MQTTTPQKDGRDPLTAFRMPAALHDAARSAAQDAGESVSAFIRRAVEDRLAQTGRAPIAR